MSGDTVTGTALQFTNDNKMCYAFSGAIEALDADQTCLDFETTSVYITARLTMTAPIRFADLANGRIRVFQLSFNDKVVGMYKTESSQEDMPSEIEVTILIPPNTHVNLICRDNSAGSTYHGTVNLTGKVGMAQRVGNLDE
jgi:hypothetical protein